VRTEQQLAGALRRVAEAEPAPGARELAQMARTAASAPRTPPRAPRRTSARAAALAAALAAVLSTTVTGSVLGWSHGAPESSSISASSYVLPVHFSALYYLEQAQRR
jgi:hypothetical protein